MTHQVLGDDGRRLDAHAEVDSTGITLLSRGGGAAGGIGARNRDYNRALPFLLQRIIAAGLPFDRAWVDSTQVQHLPTEDRTILRHHELRNGESSARLARQRMIRVGQMGNQKGGNSTKRVRLQFSAELRLSDLESALNLIRTDSDAGGETMAADLGAALEDAALGGDKGVQHLRKAKSTVSAATLSATKAAAEKNGQRGEELVWAYLLKRREAGELKSIEWVSRENAISPFDFAVVDRNHATILIDAKSTSGAFDSPFHMSWSELRAAASENRYVIYRVHLLSDDGAFLTISKDIGAMAKRVLQVELPQGIRVDSMSIDTDVVEWSEHVTLYGRIVPGQGIKSIDDEKQ